MLSGAGDAQTSFSCGVGSGSSVADDQGLIGASISISTSISQDSNLEIQGADLFLVTDLSMAFANQPATNPNEIRASLSTSSARARAHGAAVVYGRDRSTNSPRIICNARSKSLPGSFAPLPTGQESRFAGIIFENKAGATISANTEPLAIGVNSSFLLIRGNQSSIELGGNLPTEQPSEGEMDPDDKGLIHIEGNSGRITLVVNHGKIEILNNSGEITVQVNHPLGVIEVTSNSGTITVMDNQGTINDPTGTVKIGG